MKTAEAQTTLNGLDTRQMFETLNHIKAQPSLARFVFRARNRWIDGGENRTTIKDFYGAGREDDSRSEAFEFTNGEPPVLLGNNQGANPVEFLLHALVGCLTTAIVLHATARGIRIEELSSEVDGDMDLQGLLGLDPAIPASYEGIRIKMNIKADCSEEALEDLLDFVGSHSPVAETIRRPVPVTIERVSRR